jgi:steroid delta-isomerase-like uncharacterized protein
MVVRRTLLAGGSAALLGAAAPASAQSTEPTEVVSAYVAAFNEHDAAKAAELLAPNATYLDITIGEPQVGRDPIVTSVIAPYLKAVPDLHWEMRGAPIVTGGRIAFEWRISGTNSGVWPEDVPASGHAFNLDGVSIMEVRDGLITSITDYYDGLSFQSQLGWVE